MAPDQPQAVARVLLDALTALDPANPAASARAVPLALAELAEIVGDEQDQVSSVAFGAMSLAHACIALVAGLKDVDRLDVIAALRPLFSETVEDQAA